jgi:DNA-binding response OmpR family regulator
LHVLIIEGDPDVAAAMTAALEHDGHVVQTVATVSAAFELLMQGRWDVCLADVWGVDATRPLALHRLWLRELAAQVPVVAVAAQSWALDSAATERAVAGLLAKPFGLTALRAAVRAAADTRGGGGGS